MGSASHASSTLTSARRLASSLGGAAGLERPNHSAGRNNGRLGVCAVGVCAVGVCAVGVCAEGCGGVACCDVVCCDIGNCAGAGVCADADTHTSAVAATLLNTALRMASS